MHELLTGRYKRNAHIITTLHVQHADNPVYVKDVTPDASLIGTARAKPPIDKRARDVLSASQKGADSYLTGRPGIVHIGFEAVDGDDVVAESDMPRFFNP